MSSLKFCGSCTKNVPTAKNSEGFISCTQCGLVVDHDIYTDDVTFSKNAAGQSVLGGSNVYSVQGDQSASRERTLNRAYDTIIDMVNTLGVGGGDQTAKPAVRFYEIALEKNFVRGRRAEQVAAACLYISCREHNKPFLLIEFSEYLRVNVYVLGAVFLQLCKVLHLQEHPVLLKLVDPSLFIHRFSYGLLGHINPEVEHTALRILTSMKKNWMQTGRKPSGLCGAALFISALSHGFTFSRTEVHLKKLPSTAGWGVALFHHNPEPKNNESLASLDNGNKSGGSVKVVHVCEATLTKRLIEFENTESGSLTIEEFHQKAAELGNNKIFIKGNMSKEGELLCKHKGSGDPHFLHGLCEACYDEFIVMSGGLDGGSEPPAFQRAERERLAKARADENATDSLLDAEQVEISCNTPTMENTSSLDAGVDQIETSKAGMEHEDVDGLESDTANYPGTEGDESDHFSDIDDDEVGTYLYNEEEAQYKKVIWEQVNWEYIEEQAQKEAAGVLNVPKPKKERQKKTDGMNPKTASEAAGQTLSKKRVSSKLNHDRLKELFDEPISEISKKRRTESLSEKENEAEAEAEGEYDEDEHEDYVGKTAYQDYQDNPYDYVGEGYEEFDDGLF